jgi:hypothetical protein
MLGVLLRQSASSDPGHRSPLEVSIVVAIDDRLNKLRAAPEIPQLIPFSDFLSNWKSKVEFA